MRKKLIILFLSLFILTGYTFTSDCQYLRISCTLGEYTIYFPNDIDNQLSYDSVNKKLINTSSSTKYGYMNYQNDEYQVYFPQFNTPYYRVRQGSVYVYYYLENVEIIENYNITFYSKFNSDMTTYIGIVIAIFVFWGLFKK